MCNYQEYVHLKWKYLVSYYLQLGLTSCCLKPTFSKWLASGAPATHCVIFPARHFHLVLFGTERRIEGCLCADDQLRCECLPCPPEFDLFISKWGLNIQIKKKSRWTEHCIAGGLIGRFAATISPTGRRLTTLSVAEKRFSSLSTKHFSSFLWRGRSVRAANLGQRLLFYSFSVALYSSVKTEHREPVMFPLNYRDSFTRCILWHWCVIRRGGRMWAFVISMVLVIFYGRQYGRFFTFTFQ